MADTISTTWSTSNAIFTTNIEEEFEKKSFDDDEYKRLQQEVDLLEESSKKKLQQDSSEFGRGYGVEHGKDYYVWKYDSITGEVAVTDSLRKSGSSFPNDGIRRGNSNDIRSRREQARRTKNKGIDAERVKRSDRRFEKEKERRDREAHQSNGGYSGGIGTFFLIVLFAFAIGLIIYVLIINKPIEGGSKKINYVQDIDPTTVQLSELELKIMEAEKAEDYRIAIRYYFIWVLKELSDRNHILWKKKKTNHHYLSEVMGKSFYLGFNKIVNLFEYIWYGKYTLTQQEYTLVKKDFLQLIQQLKGNE